MAIPIKTEIRLDSSKASAGVSRFKTKIGGLKQSLGGMKGMIAGAFAFGGMNALLQKFDRFGKLAQRFDLPATTIQKLDHAAQLAGTSVESMAKAMTKATLSGQDAGDGLSTMVRAFEDLGINVEDFNKLSPEDQLLAVEDAFINSADRGEAYAATLKILGTRAQEIIPSFGSLKESMDSTSVASDETVNKIQALNDKFTSFKQTLQVAIVSSIDWIQNLGTTWAAVADGVMTTATRMGNAIGTLAKGDIGGVKNVFNEYLKDLERIKDLRNEIVNGDPAGKNKKTVGEGGLEEAKSAATGTDKSARDAAMDAWRSGRADKYNKSKADKDAALQAGRDQAKKDAEELKALGSPEDRARIAGAKRQEGFNASIKGIQSPLDQLKEQRQGMNPFNVTASSLAAIGGGGKAVGSASPELKKLDKQIGLLEEQITILENMRDSDGATMK